MLFHITSMILKCGRRLFIFIAKTILSTQIGCSHLSDIVHHVKSGVCVFSFPLADREHRADTSACSRQPVLASLGIQGTLPPC